MYESIIKQIKWDKTASACAFSAKCATTEEHPWKWRGIGVWGVSEMGKKNSKDKRVHVIMSYGMMAIPHLLFFFFLSCFWRQRRTNRKTGEMIKSHDGEVSDWTDCLHLVASYQRQRVHWQTRCGKQDVCTHTLQSAHSFLTPVHVDARQIQG